MIPFGNGLLGYGNNFSNQRQSVPKITRGNPDTIFIKENPAKESCSFVFSLVKELRRLLPNLSFPRTISDTGTISSEFSLCATYSIHRALPLPGWAQNMKALTLLCIPKTIANKLLLWECNYLLFAHMFRSREITLQVHGILRNIKHYNY